MKILYLDLGAGAAGDMLAGALLELLPPVAQAAFLETMNALGLPGVAVSAERTAQCGVTGTRFRVTVRGAEEHEHDHDDHDHDHEHDHGHDHAHAGPAEIRAAVEALDLDSGAAAEVLAVYDAIAAAESEVHGVPVADIHFHELGTMDALADITAVTLLLRALAPARVVASPVAVGSGTVRCAHGLLPVPAPATALLLRGVPVLAGPGEGERCTPTGAALVKRFASGFGPLPPMTPETVGCGFGSKEFPGRPNCVRAILGEAWDAASSPQTTERVVELQCNLDDMTAEDVGFAMDRLYAAGALEVFTVACGMKKCRPGVLLTALCREEQRGAVLGAMLAHTTTLGVRSTLRERYTLERRTETVDTALGPVRRKSAAGFGVARRKWEYDDLAALAAKWDMTLEELREALDADGQIQ